MSEKTLYLIRHALPDYPDGERLCLGQTMDLPLSKTGLEQAEQLGRIFADKELEAVYTSPLLRAVQTAQGVAAGHTQVIADPRLIELHGGVWDGKPMRGIREKYPMYFAPGAASTCPPGGETDEAGFARAWPAFEEIWQRTQKCAAIVAHGGINRVLLCHLLGLPFSEKKKLRQGFASVSAIQRINNAWEVKQIID